MTTSEMKRAVGYKAVDDFVRSGMTVGLGSGSTAAYAVERIGQKLKAGDLRDIRGVPTSETTRQLAEKLNIPLRTLDDIDHIDVAIDGADEVDEELNLVKGRGAALLREKMVEEGATTFVVIVDSAKIQKHGLGLSGGMPVEVNKYCFEYIRRKLLKLDSVKGCEAKLRLEKDGSPLETDNQNYIIDLYFDKPIRDPYKAATDLKSIVGVVEHGLFMNMANVCLVGQPDGTVTVMYPKSRK